MAWCVNYQKQWIKGSLVNFICEAKSVLKQNVLIIVTCPSKVVQWTEPCFPSWLLFSVFIESFRIKNSFERFVYWFVCWNWHSLIWKVGNRWHTGLLYYYIHLKMWVNKNPEAVSFHSIHFLSTFCCLDKNWIFHHTNSAIHKATGLPGNIPT